MRFTWLLLFLVLVGCGAPPAKFFFSEMAPVVARDRSVQIDIALDPCLDEYQMEVVETVNILSYYGIHVHVGPSATWSIHCAYDQPTEASEWVGLANTVSGITVRIPYFEERSSAYRVSLLMHELIHLLGVGHNDALNSVMYPVNLPNIFFTKMDILAIDKAIESLKPFDMAEFENGTQ